MEEAQTELRGAFKYQDEMKRLVDEHDNAEKAGNEDLKRKIKDEARELAKKIKIEG